MKYFLVKGCNGFGNMMSVLSLAYEIVRNNNITLVIDWIHPEWQLGFDKYFHLDKINYMKYEDFKKINLERDLKFFPEQFNKGNIVKPLVETYPNLDKENKYNEIFDPVIQIFTGSSHININSYDVLVFSYNWLGYNYIKNLWGDLRLNNNLKENINNKIKNLGEYSAMHVRHTDNKNQTTTWFTDYLKNNLDKKIYVATDNEIILNICKNIHPNIINYTKFYEKGQPLHTQNLSEENKNQSNIDTIVDMYILINSKELIITPIKTIPYMTTYSLMAMAIKN
jgi:hypothetical protein